MDIQREFIFIYAESKKEQDVKLTILTLRKVWVIKFHRFVQNSVGVVLLVRGESNNGRVANPFTFSPNAFISKVNLSVKYSSTVRTGTNGNK